MRRAWFTYPQEHCSEALLIDYFRVPQGHSDWRWRAVEHPCLQMQAYKHARSVP